MYNLPNGYRDSTGTPYSDKFVHQGIKTGGRGRRLNTQYDYLAGLVDMKIENEITEEMINEWNRTH
jgi:hypothetical protein